MWSFKNFQVYVRPNLQPPRATSREDVFDLAGEPRDGTTAEPLPLVNPVETHLGQIERVDKRIDSPNNLVNEPIERAAALA